MYTLRRSLILYILILNSLKMQTSERAYVNSGASPRLPVKPSRTLSQHDLHKFVSNFAIPSWLLEASESRLNPINRNEPWSPGGNRSARQLTQVQDCEIYEELNYEDVLSKQGEAIYRITLPMREAVERQKTEEEGTITGGSPIHLSRLPQVEDSPAHGVREFPTKFESVTNSKRSSFIGMPDPLSENNSGLFDPYKPGTPFVGFLQDLPPFAVSSMTPSHRGTTSANKSTTSHTGTDSVRSTVMGCIYSTHNREIRYEPPKTVNKARKNVEST